MEIVNVRKSEIEEVTETSVSKNEQEKFHGVDETNGMCLHALAL